MKFRYWLTAALLCAAAYGGMRYEATTVQRTCETDAPTMLNGTAYICITLEQAQGIRERLQQHGA
jgi:hypothetical protein